MAISLASLNRATAPKPPRILIHGVAGVGKTTFAAGTPDPVFVLTEDGLGTLEVEHFPLARTFDDVDAALTALYAEEHGFKSLVIDSVDWLEPLIWAKACQLNGWKSIEDAGYGKGYVAALDLWRQYVEAINTLRDQKGKRRDIVLDPFGGSGSTLIACEKAGRHARLIELDPKYVDVIIQRWQGFSGGAATLDGDGRAFNDIARASRGFEAATQELAG